MIRILLILPVLTMAATFTPIPTSPVPNTVVSKGALLTGDGTQDVIAPACADGEILEWDSLEIDGVKCVTKPITINSGGGVVGEIKDFHTFGGTLSIPRGWMIANGDVVDLTNYEAIHGVGTYSADGVASSLLLNKNLPDMIGKYAVGAASTAQDGSVAIASVGNASNQVDLQHVHSGPNHNHQWLSIASGGGSSAASTYNSGGSTITVETTEYNKLSNTGWWIFNFGIPNNDPAVNYYTNYASGTTGDGLSTTQSIQPESIEVIKIIKVI